MELIEELSKELSVREELCECYVG